MFQEQELNAYRSIQAPSELYEKIMSARKPKRHWGRYVTGVAAACLVLAMGAGFFFRGGEPGIMIQGQSLENSIVYYDLSPASEMRSSPTITVPLELELPRKSRICVTHGQLTGEGIESGKEWTASGSVSLLWEIPRGTELPVCELSIDDGKEITTLTLTYEETKIRITKKGE